MIEKLIIPLDYIILAVGCLIVIFCFWRGITASILGLLTWLGSIIININIFKNYEQITSILATLISIPLIFLISLFILKKIRKIISSDIDKQILGLLVDKVLGFLFGFIFSYIIFSTIIYFTNNFELLNFLNDWLLNNSYLLSEIDNFNDSLLNSIIGVEEEDIS